MRYHFFSRIITVLMLFLIFTFRLSAQAQDEYKKIVYQDKIYQTGSSWFTIGAGAGFETSLKDLEKNLSMGINFRIKDQYFNVGYHFSSDEMIYKRSMQRLTDLHVGIGIRREDLKHNVYFFGGPSNSYGYIYNYSDSTGTKYYKGFNTIGIYTEFQYTWKIFYDIGIGPSFYANINQYYKVVGVQLHLYFSTAYRNKIDFIKMNP
ncbi:MAG: hypothetical protein NTW49_06235 [Bacteroidia bacterium]|nr:hypothetical protein [Bacteroidia bacterium]